MDITITPGLLSGTVSAIPSKSQAHRILIAAAFSDGPTEIFCPETNRDMDATANCLRALGADIRKSESGYRVLPAVSIPETAVLPCQDSGSTLRFLLPVVGALGTDALFQMEGRLPQRPLSPLWEEMEKMGCRLSRPSEATLRCEGTLHSGEYTVDAGISSQFLTGLLLAFPLMNGDSRLTLTGHFQSRPYVDMTLKVMDVFGISISDFSVPSGSRFHSPGRISVEGDWSNGAFFLAASALGSQVDVTNLDPGSPQGDRTAAELISQLKSGCQTISAADIPDLVPILAVTAATFHGARFEDIQRLRLKESDRVQSVIAMLEALGGKASADASTLTVFPTHFHGGTVDSVNDHRIAMSAAIAATICSDPVTILGAQCVSKSYPRFWDEYTRLGGQYEQYIR